MRSRASGCGVCGANLASVHRHTPRQTSILAKTKVYIFTFSNTGHLHRMCTNVSFSAPHLLHEGVFALLILCSMYCRLICPVRSPTDILECFLSSLLINRAYLSVDPSRRSWLVPYFSQTFHSVCFLFSIQFLILDFNLLRIVVGRVLDR